MGSENAKRGRARLMKPFLNVDISLSSTGSAPFGPHPSLFFSFRARLKIMKHMVIQNKIDTKILHLAKTRQKNLTNLNLKILKLVRRD
jgi:hypothetical protein